MSSYRYWNGQVYDLPPGHEEDGAIYDIKLQPVNAAEVPPALANAPRWCLYDYMGDIDGESVAEPQFEHLRTLPDALKELERWRAKARVTHPQAKRELGYVLAEGECAIIHHTPPGPKPNYTAMLIREAMAGGAYHEYDAHCNHIIIGKLQPGAYIEGKPDPAATKVSEAAIAARIETLRGRIKDQHRRDARRRAEAAHSGGQRDRQHGNRGKREGPTGRGAWRRAASAYRRV